MANRLASEISPYLLQHAHNPVDWWPWSPEAFDEARRRDVPIFLSIGYSTCYWCHVMERESFESEAIAQVLNERCVCVKVDREELPFVDDVYMNAVVAMTGQGGWPMSVFLEPTELKPIWGGTYFPPEPRHGRPSITQIADGISEGWRDDRESMLAQAEKLAEAVRENIGQLAAPVRVGPEQVGACITQLLTRHDATHGGFDGRGAHGGGQGPKFPQPSYMQFLMDARAYVQEDDVVSAIDAAVRTTLDKIAAGGIHDHVGGGFHRYSVDGTWTVPHFEKMLYDNALLAIVYAQAAHTYMDTHYKAVAQRTLAYVLREMTGEHGGFFSAQDAEVQGREGGSYVWRAEQIDDVLDGEDAAFIKGVYMVDKGPNFRDPHHPESEPVSVLRMADRPDVIAQQMGMEPEAFETKLHDVNERLLAARRQQPQEAVDEKAVAAWNGMMIVAMVRGGQVLDEGLYLEAAQRAADFVLGAMRDERGRLCRVFKDGQRRGAGGLEDYAWVISGLVALGGASGLDEDTRSGYVREAAALAEVAQSLFAAGEPSDGYFDASVEDAGARVLGWVGSMGGGGGRGGYDGAVPSGVSVMIHALMGLHEASGEQKYAQRAAGALVSVSGLMARSPVGAVNSVRGLLRGQVVMGDMLAEAMAACATAEETNSVDGERGGNGGEGGVEVMASAERVTLRDGKPSGVMLRVEIPEGWHVYAAEPGCEGVVGLRVGVVHGRGVAAYADYPEGEWYGPQGEQVRVYKGAVEFGVVVEREEGVAWEGRPTLVVTYQACCGDACEAPATVELDIAIDRV